MVSLWTTWTSCTLHLHMRSYVEKSPALHFCLIPCSCSSVHAYFTMLPQPSAASSTTTTTTTTTTTSVSSHFSVTNTVRVEFLSQCLRQLVSTKQPTGMYILCVVYELCLYVLRGLHLSYSLGYFIGSNAISTSALLLLIASPAYLWYIRSAGAVYVLVMRWLSMQPSSTHNTSSSSGASTDRWVLFR